MGMRKLNIYFTERQLIALEGLRKETGLSLSEHLRRAIDLYFTQLGIIEVSKWPAVTRK